MVPLREPRPGRTSSIGAKSREALCADITLSSADKERGLCRLHRLNRLNSLDRAQNPWG